MEYPNQIEHGAYHNKGKSDTAEKDDGQDGGEGLRVQRDPYKSADKENQLAEDTEGEGEEVGRVEVTLPVVKTTFETVLDWAIEGEGEQEQDDTTDLDETD